LNCRAAQDHKSLAISCGTATRRTLGGRDEEEIASSRGSRSCTLNADKAHGVFASSIASYYDRVLSADADIEARNGTNSIRRAEYDQAMLPMPVVSHCLIVRSAEEDIDSSRGVGDLTSQAATDHAVFVRHFGSHSQIA